MPSPNRSPLQISRRQFLQLASAGVSAAGISSTGLFDSLRLHADEVRKKGRACIVVWLAGAPSQLELWDPKPGTVNGGETKAIQTSAPGIEIAHFWPEVAKQMQDVALLRTIVGKEAAHERGKYHLQTGRRLTGASRHPALGSVVARELGDPQSDMPNFVTFGKSASAGFLGVQFAPFEIDQPGALPDDVKQLVTNQRLSQRLGMLAEQDADFAKAGAKNLVDERQTLYERANKMMHSSRLTSFQLTDESAKTKADYGDNRFGQGLLVARRLVEQGVPFVQVAREGWDMHTDLYARMKKSSADVDQGLSALLSDLKQRGLLESTLVVCLGEFGRTPKINSRGSNPGRDHWARNFNAFLAGAGIRGGQAVGKTSSNGQEITDRALSVEDLFQTLCRALHIDASKELITPEGRPLKIVDGGEPIKELFA